MARRHTGVDIHLVLLFSSHKLCNLCTSKSLARGTWNARIIRVGRNILTQAVRPIAERSTGTKFWHRWRATIGRGTPDQSTTRWYISYLNIHICRVDHPQKYNDTKRWQTEPGGSSKSILMIEISELQITSNHQLEASIETTRHLTLPGRTSSSRYHARADGDSNLSVSTQLLPVNFLP